MAWRGGVGIRGDLQGSVGRGEGQAAAGAAAWTGDPGPSWALWVDGHILHFLEGRSSFSRLRFVPYQTGRFCLSGLSCRRPAARVRAGRHRAPAVACVVGQEGPPAATSGPVRGVTTVGS